MVLMVVVSIAQSSSSSTLVVGVAVAVHQFQSRSQRIERLIRLSPLFHHCILDISAPKEKDENDANANAKGILDYFEVAFSSSAVEAVAAFCGSSVVEVGYTVIADFGTFHDGW